MGLWFIHHCTGIAAHGRSDGKGAVCPSLLAMSFSRKEIMIVFSFVLQARVA
jgi:hypothetical protein